jgi:hypothetical protein
VGVSRELKSGALVKAHALSPGLCFYLVSVREIAFVKRAVMSGEGAGRPPARDNLVSAD